MVYLRMSTAKAAPNASFYHHDDDAVIAAEAFNRGSEDLLGDVRRVVAASVARGDAIDTVISQIRSIRAAG